MHEGRALCAKVSLRACQGGIPCCIPSVHAREGYPAVYRHARGVPTGVTLPACTGVSRAGRGTSAQSALASSKIRKRETSAQSALASSILRRKRETSAQSAPTRARTASSRMPCVRQHLPVSLLVDVAVRDGVPHWAGDGRLEASLGLVPVSLLVDSSAIDRKVKKGEKQWRSGRAAGMSITRFTVGRCCGNYAHSVIPAPTPHETGRKSGIPPSPVSLLV